MRLAKIKTRERVKNIKTIEKGAIAGEHTKNALIRTKDKAERSIPDEDGRSPSQYAGDKVQGTAVDTAYIAALQGRRLAHKGQKTLKERHKQEEVHEQESVLNREQSTSLRSAARTGATPTEKSKVAEGEVGLQPVSRHSAAETPRQEVKAAPSPKLQGISEQKVQPAYDVPIERGRLYAQCAAQHRAADPRREPKTISHGIGRQSATSTTEQDPSTPTEQGRRLAQHRAAKQVQERRHGRELARQSDPIVAEKGRTPIDDTPIERGRRLTESRQAELGRGKRNEAKSAYQDRFRSPRTNMARQSGISTKQSSRPKQMKPGQKGLKASNRAVKTAEQTAKTAIKTSQASMRATQKAAQATERATRAGVQAARAAAKAAAVSAKAVVKALKAAVKAITEAVRNLIAAVAAGGSVAVFAIIIICLIGLIVASPFGIFFAGNNKTAETVPVSAAVAQVNYDFNAYLEALQDGDYSSIDVSGTIADWPEMLAVFAVKVAGSEDVDAMDVATMDATRISKLKEVFWAMNSVTSTVESIPHPDSDPDDDTDDSWTEYILHITITPKTAETAKTAYRFTEKQKESLDELLENRDALLELIGDLVFISADAQDIIRNLPSDLSDERREVVKTACSLVGKVTYFWGGKSLVIGWDSRWGTIQKVWADGNDTTGTYRPYGLDCSGFVDWVFYNMTDGAYVIGHGGGATMQHNYCTPITWANAIPGDLVFYPEDSHVGIVGGRDEAGNLLIVHCASGYNCVVVTGANGFTSIGRPLFYTD